MVGLACLNLHLNCHATFSRHAELEQFLGAVGWNPSEGHEQRSALLKHIQQLANGALSHNHLPVNLNQGETVTVDVSSEVVVESLLRLGDQVPKLVLGRHCLQELLVDAAGHNFKSAAGLSRVKGGADALHNALHGAALKHDHISNELVLEVFAADLILF
jgi:hypothetical protein